MDQFRKRIETIFKNYYVEEYLESPDGVCFPDGSAPWVEFNLIESGTSNGTSVVCFRDLNKLSGLLGTKNIEVTGWTRAFEPPTYDGGRRNVIYVVAYGVHFKKRSRK